MHILAGHRTENIDFWRFMLELYLRMWLLGSPDTDIVSFHLATDMGCGFITEDDSFYEIIFLHFQLHLLAKVTPFHFAGVRACTNHILYGLKHSRLRNTFHTIIFGMSNSLLALAPDLQGNSLKSLSLSFNVVIRHTRSTRTFAFTQASSFHKLSVPPIYIIPVWCVFSKPCTKLTSHGNHRSRHL